jgi:NitT/TauT family transport system substrate-binding protein
MDKKIIMVGILMAVIVIGIVSYFWLGQEQPEKYSGPIEKVTLGVESSLLPAAVWIAENKDYFQEEGLDLTIKEFDSGKQSLMAMLNGGERIDISTAAPTPIILNSFDRQDFSIIATFAYGYTDIKVTARKDRGITTATDLKGKKIGTPAGTTGQFFVESFLIYNKIEPSEVEIIDISPSELPHALENNQVDAIVIWEPHGYNARKLIGDNAIIIPSLGVYKCAFNFLMMKDFVEENPEVIKKFLRAVDRATTFMKDHKEESQDIVAERLNLDGELMNIFWEDFVFEISLQQSLIITLEDEARWAIKNNLTDKTQVPNYLDYVHLDTLYELKPNLVNIIH